MKSDKNLPVFGIGPFYVTICTILTAFGLFSDYKGYFNAGKIYQGKIFFKFFAIALILFGIFLRVKAVLFQKINVKVKEGKLLTDGVYAIVRNPVYSAFYFIFTGMLLFTSYLLLLVFPVVFRIFLTVLIKKTEEKRLFEYFAREYEDYCKKVNRIFPSFRKK